MNHLCCIHRAGFTCWGAIRIQQNQLQLRYLASSFTFVGLLLTCCFKSRLPLLRSFAFLVHSKGQCHKRIRLCSPFFLVKQGSVKCGRLVGHDILEPGLVKATLKGHLGAWMLIGVIKCVCVHVCTCVWVV